VGVGVGSPRGVSDHLWGVGGKTFHFYVSNPRGALGGDYGVGLGPPDPQRLVLPHGTLARGSGGVPSGGIVDRYTLSPLGTLPYVPR
jgi:hypothetical protein